MQRALLTGSEKAMMPGLCYGVCERVMDCEYWSASRSAYSSAYLYRTAKHSTAHAAQKRKHGRYCTSTVQQYLESGQSDNIYYSNNNYYYGTANSSLRFKQCTCSLSYLGEDRASLSIPANRSLPYRTVLYCTFPHSQCCTEY